MMKKEISVSDNLQDIIILKYQKVLTIYDSKQIELVRS